MIWFFLAVMLLAAAAIVARPLHRRGGGTTPTLAAAVATVLLVSGLVYWRVGTPVLPETFGSVEAMVASLAERLQENPEDIEGWRLLGASYLEMEDYSRAVAAFERVVEMESSSNATSLAQLGEAVMATGPASAERADSLFEMALNLEPANPRALFFGGLAAAERGALDTAAQRWETMLALSPPPEVENILRQGIAEWRGGKQAAPLLAVNVSLAERAATAVAPDATVWIIARDPQQPSPPIAAARRRVADLPAKISLGDGDAMMPDRLLSAYREVEVVVRVSQSGEPVARPGDWYGEGLAATGADEAVDIVIAREVEAAGATASD